MKFRSVKQEPAQLQMDHVSVLIKPENIWILYQWLSFSLWSPVNVGPFFNFCSGGLTATKERNITHPQHVHDAITGKRGSHRFLWTSSWSPPGKIPASSSFSRLHLDRQEPGNIFLRTTNTPASFTHPRHTAVRRPSDRQSCCCCGFTC